MCIVRPEMIDCERLATCSGLNIRPNSQQADASRPGGRGCNRSARRTNLLVERDEHVRQGGERTKIDGLRMRNAPRAFPRNMPASRVVGSIWRTLVDAPGVFFVHKYNQLKRHRQPDSRVKVTENELQRLNGKIVSRA